MTMIGQLPRLLIIILLLTTPLLSIAKVYKWVDDSGKVHFSDTPPAGNIKADEKIIKLRSSGNSSVSLVGFNAKIASRNKPIRYEGQHESRRIRLENVVMDLEKGEGGRNIIGADYSGSSCSKRGTTMAWSKGRAEIEVKKYQQQFNKVITEYGYASEGAGRLFGGQQVDKAE